MKKNSRYNMEIFFDIEQLFPASANTFLKDKLQSVQNSILQQ